MGAGKAPHPRGSGDQPSSSFDMLYGPEQNPDSLPLTTTTAVVASRELDGMAVLLTGGVKPVRMSASLCLQAPLQRLLQ